VNTHLVPYRQKPFEWQPVWAEQEEERLTQTRSFHDANHILLVFDTLTFDSVSHLVAYQVG